jgi:hypothetical protein
MFLKELMKTYSQCLKKALVTQNSSDLSLRIQCIRPQTGDAIPLKINYGLLKNILDMGNQEFFPLVVVAHSTDSVKNLVVVTLSTDSVKN